jgi:phosphohistidine swiveling domain-containing protein
MTETTRITAANILNASSTQDQFPDNLSTLVSKDHTIITISHNLTIQAAELHPESTGIVIGNREQFLADFITELNKERFENGASLITQAFDRALEKTFENSDSVTFKEEE